MTVPPDGRRASAALTVAVVFALVEVPSVFAFVRGYPKTTRDLGIITTLLHGLELLLALGWVAATTLTVALPAYLIVRWLARPQHDRSEGDARLWFAQGLVRVLLWTPVVVAVVTVVLRSIVSP